ncbi:DUF1828 domain-containing protein [Coraliomargarita algicola]|uniref:DUF1828 domain-containing protein n=1 Tax=Coraliomargarita algicola TaxID=3092156 RepID=A0ABZ0RI88_9BACT|nr:DUF1828 domain-containing protein [Coraliomargarita sp. J2-16]WPJ95232.1 DUF1828 domain-containing protein [Coraliomargarita sp. J2-16]
MSADSLLTETNFRLELNSFWDSILEIEPIADGLAFTMPCAYPDGWQITLELKQKTPKGFLLTDQGKTLSWLTARGHNIATEAMRAHLKRYRAEHFMEEENGVLYRWLTVPLEPADIHVFAEGLAAIARLEILHEVRPAEANIADNLVQRTFKDAQLEPTRHHKLSITKDRSVTVDYFVNEKRPLAVQLIKTKSDISGTMEKWGFRWHELKKAYTGLAPIMLYDRNTQVIDAYSRHIGESECELFCGYDETDRIHSVLESIR